MATVFITPNMNLPSPIPGQEPGPTWATDNYNCFALVDSHSHSAGQGVQITPAGMNINVDLTFASNNAYALRSVRFTPQLSPLALAADIGCLYESGVDLYYNDGSGNQIRMTQGGAVSGSAGTITGLPSGTASAAYVAVSGTFVFQQATSTAANMDIGTLIVRYPGSYPTPSGNYIAIEAPASLASGFAITLPATLPVANYPVSLNSLGVLTANQISGGQIISQTITAANIANNTITAAQIAASTITGTEIATNVNLNGVHVQAGSSNVVVSSSNATNSLAVIRVVINAAGTPIGGEGIISVAHGVTGQYLLTFSTAFSDIPVAVASVTEAFPAVATIASASTTQVQVNTYNTTSGAASDRAFSVVIIGQRV